MESVQKAAPVPVRSALAKGLALLSVIAECGNDGMSLSAAARRAKLHSATAHRLLNALVEANYLSFDPYIKRYHLGLMPYQIVAQAGQDLAFLDLRRRMRRSLQTVQADVGGVVCLSVRSRHEALCIDLIAGETKITVNTLEIGSRRPLGAGAASLALLACLPENEREAVIRHESERYLKYGRLTAQIVRDACTGLERDGYVANEAVIIPDIVALAVPVFDGPKLLAAMSVTNTTSRLAEPYRREIVRTMQTVVREAGFSTTPEG